MMKNIKTFIFVLSVLFSLNAVAQCKLSNTYFQAGEELTMDLYFKYGLINMKAGTSKLTTVSENYNGQEAYKMTLLAASSGNARKIFPLNDTLSCYMTKDLVPLAYIKNAREDDDYTQERVKYSYANGLVSINTKRTKNGGFRFDETLTSTTCIYDMMSVVYYARALDYTSMKKGDTNKVSFISGKNKVSMVIEHDGLETIEANDGKKYRCIKLVLSIMDDAFSDKKEAMKVYITNDSNHMPVRLDSKLKIGSTRAILRSHKGTRYPVQSFN